MDISANSNGIFQSLNQRELSGECFKLQKSAQNALQSRIPRDLFSSKVIQIPRSSSLLDVERVTRLNSLLAVKGIRTISLWDLFEGVRLWECDRVIDGDDENERIFQDELLIGNDGRVVHVKDNFCEFFYEGKKTGHSMLTSILKHFKFINGYLFGITSSYRFVDGGQRQLEYLCKWSDAGNRAFKISLKDLGNVKYSTSNDKYYIVCGDMKVGDKFVSKFLIHNIENNTHKIYFIESENSQQTEAMYLCGDHLYMGISQSFINSSEDSVVETTILSFNILTSVIEREYSIRDYDRSIKRLFIGGNQAFFVGTTINRRMERVFYDLISINLIDGVQKLLFRFDLFVSEDISVETLISEFCLVGNCLVVCHDSNPLYLDDEYRQVKSVFDITIGLKLHNVEYEFKDAEQKISFESGMLLISHLDNETYMKFYTENHYTFSDEKSPKSWRIN